MGSIIGHRIDYNGVGEASGTYPAKSAPPGGGGWGGWCEAHMKT